MASRKIALKGYRIASVLAGLILLSGTCYLRGDAWDPSLLHPQANETATSSSEGPLFVATQPVLEAVLQNPQALQTLPLAPLDMETLWLARCIYSETKRLEEQELVAWVVRNRVETAFRGKQTYRDVVLDPHQFSALHPRHPKYHYYTSLTPASYAPGWQQTLRIASLVRHAHPEARPFSPTTRHFFSERSLKDTAPPAWTRAGQPITPNRKATPDAHRFQFYDGVL